MSVRIRTVVARFAVLVGILSCFAPRNAAAYTYESAVSGGCHERITMEALRRSRQANANANATATAPPLSPNASERALIADLPYRLDSDMHDVSGAALTIGVRDNDLKGRGPAEVDQIAQVHGDPSAQREHCLRAKADDEPLGTQQALEACRGFIREKVADALLGLDANGAVDPTQRAEIEIALELRGGVSASLPRFYVRMGQALHTLQDSFAHTFRTPDHIRVRTALNWIDWIEQDEVESRDGPIHRNGLDQCDNVDAFRTQNIDVATQASFELLNALLDPSTHTREEKLAAADAVIAKYVSYEPGCTADNGWCDAPERSYEIERGCGCAVVGANAHATGGIAIALGALVFLARRRRRRGRGRRRMLAGAAMSALLIILSSTNASAQEPEATPTEPEPPPPPPPVTPKEIKEEVTKKERAESLVRIYAAGSASVSNPSLSGQLGGRLRLSDRWLVGLDGELNGWIGVHTGKLRTGAFNAYATVILRYPLRFQAVNLRTTANLGTSTMLIDLYGAPRGTTGIFLGLTPLGLEWQLSKRFYAIIDALGIALPIPQLQGAPFAYPQYRAALGLEVAL